MAHLITIVKRDFGAAYNPRIRDNILAGVRERTKDSRDNFIHGLLDDDPKRRWGTCASIPVLITAVARRLGYPVGLAVAGRHIYARWEGGGVSFNIEASNPKGMTIPSDDSLREIARKTELHPGEEKSGYFLRTLFPAEEFALFLTIRVEMLFCAARYDETLLWSARALQFAPDDPRFPYLAYDALELALRNRHRQANSKHLTPFHDDSRSFSCNAGDLLSRGERPLFLTILAHHSEARGEIAEARVRYEDSCRQNFFGNNEQRDLQRFLKKHNIPRRTGPLMPPSNLGQPRQWKLACKPHEEAALLRQLADYFERNGELVKARDALHDLYMFDPADAEVFQRARSFENRPQFQEQLRAFVENRRRELQTRKERSD